LPRIDGWERVLGTLDLRGQRVAFVPNLGNAMLDPEVERVVVDAGEALIGAAGLQRVDVEVRMPEKAAAWANAGAPSLFDDLKDHWPDCRDDLTYEIRAGMEFMDRYRISHAASVDRFRMAMNEAMADVFEQVDIVVCATNPI